MVLHCTETQCKCWGQVDGGRAWFWNKVAEECLSEKEWFSNYNSGFPMMKLKPMPTDISKLFHGS